MSWEKIFDARGLVVIAAVLFLVGGMIGDTICAAFLALWIAGVVAVYLQRDIEPGGARHIAMGLSGLSIAVVLIPVVSALLPGTPVAHASLAQGGHLALPADIEGAVRIQVHADIPAPGPAAVDYRIAGLDEPIDGRLERTEGSSRVGKRRVRTENVRDTEVRSARVGPSHDLSVEIVRGATGPLDVAVYRERWTTARELILGGVLFVACLAFAVRRRSESGVPIAAAAVCFGVLAYRWLQPAAALGPEIGALVVASACGLAVYVPWRWVIRRVQTAK